MEKEERTTEGDVMEKGGVKKGRKRKGDRL